MKHETTIAEITHHKNLDLPEDEDELTNDITKIEELNTVDK